VAHVLTIPSVGQCLGRLSPPSRVALSIVRRALAHAHADVHIGCVAKTKRIQVLMEPGEFDELERMAGSRGTSVGELMRQAARAQHLATVGSGRRAAAAQRFLGLPDVRLPEWKKLRKEIERRRGAHLS
jgi:hypothetical protein